MGGVVAASNDVKADQLCFSSVIFKETSDVRHKGFEEVHDNCCIFIQ